MVLFASRAFAEAPSTVEAVGTSTLASTETSTLTPTATSTVYAPADEPLAPELPPAPAAETRTTTGLPLGVEPAEPTRIGSVELPTQLGPAMIDAGAGRIRLGLSTQLQSTFFDGDEGGGARSLDANVLIRRLRTVISGRFLEDRLSFAFQLNTTPGNFEVLDMWIDLEIRSMFRVRLGQFKVPFTAYRQQSFSRTMLVDWSLASVWFGAERQLGVMVHDEASGPFDYAIGVFTGQNRRASFNTGLAELYGEPVTNPSRVDGIGEVDRIHPEIVGSLTYRSPGYSSSSLSDRSGGPLRYLLVFSSAVDIQPEEARDDAARFGLEAWFKYAHWSIVTTTYASLNETTQTDRFILGAAGGHVQTAYRFTQQFELALRYALVALTPSLSDDARDRGQAIIQSAATPEETEALRAQYGDAGDLRSEQEVTLGGSWFIVGHSLKFSADAGWLWRALRGGDRHDLRIRLQAQLSF